MTLTAHALPLHEVDGVVRARGTRVTLDTIVTVFNAGATPEEIVQKYPSLKLADLYAIIGYYLSNRIDVDAYIRERERQAEVIRRENEQRFDLHGIRERLLTRRVERE